MQAKTRKPIPWAISLGLAFLPDELDDVQYEQAVRDLIRRKLPTIRDDLSAPRLFEQYDDWVSDLIEQELSKG